MNPFKKNKNEILYNIVNSVIAGGLVFAGSVADGSVTSTGIIAAAGAAGLVALVKFKEYWSTQKSEYTSKILTFI